MSLVETVCALAGDDDLIGKRTDPEINRLREAIQRCDTPFLYEYMMEAFSMQGISDTAAYSYMDRHGRVTWGEVEKAFSRNPYCKRLGSYWSFESCNFRKEAGSCGEPKLLGSCPLPKHDLRNGRINQTAYSLFLFIRDVANGDIVGWIDNRLRLVRGRNPAEQRADVREVLVDPLCNLFGVANKLANMTLAHLLTAAPEDRLHWHVAGASMLAVDTLVHNFLHRTGMLCRLNSEHPYGLGCYAESGCADALTRIAHKIDARKFNPSFPKQFPRYVQYAIWRYCAQLELNVCNGNNIDDNARCENTSCAVFNLCDRLALRLGP